MLNQMLMPYKRYADFKGRSGRAEYWWFVRFVPLVGGLIVLVFMCMAGTKGDNRFGTDPHDKFGAETFA